MTDWPHSPYDDKTIAEVIYDYAVVRGDLTEQYARDQLVRIIERRIAEDARRVWFTKPQWHWFGWRTLIPYYWGGDEFDRHVWTFGWTITGRVNIAVRACPNTGRCADRAVPVQ